VPSPGPSTSIRPRSIAFWTDRALCRFSVPLSRTGPILGALVAAALGYALLLRMEPSSTYLHMLPAQILARLGIGAAIPLTTSMLLSAASKAQAGIASAGLNAVRQAGAAIGVAVFGALMSGDAPRGFEIAIMVSAGLLFAAVATAVVALRPT